MKKAGKRGGGAEIPSIAPGPALAAENIDPELMNDLFSSPEIQMAICDITQNGANPMKYANDPVVGPFIMKTFAAMTEHDGLQIPKMIPDID
jgi:hypothetical protein